MIRCRLHSKIVLTRDRILLKAEKFSDKYLRHPLNTGEITSTYTFIRKITMDRIHSKVIANARIEIMTKEEEI